MTQIKVDDANREQIDYWNESAGPKWVRAETLLDEQLSAFGLAAIDAARLEPGQRVLDVGCGCGDTTLEIARRVGPTGTALGVDVSAPMLARATERARDRSLRNVRFEQADAATYRGQEDARFDALVSRFGVMFFSNPVAAFANLRELLAPNARLSFVCWQAVQKNPWMLVPLAAAAEHVPIVRPADPYAPGPFAFADADRTVRILADAGFAAVSCDAFEIEIAVAGGRPLDESVEFLMNLGPLGRALTENPEVDRALVVDAVRRAVLPFDTGNGVRMAAAAWVITASAG